MRTWNRLRRLMVVVTLAVGSLVTVVSAAEAVPLNACDGQSYTKLVANYHRGTALYGMRCGTTSWGFIHVKPRWNTTFDSNIALTISRGEDVADVEQDGGSVIFALFDNSCNELFRVIYNGGAYNGNGIRPQGIITAYYITHGGPARVGADAVVTPQYRTDCPVNQSI